VKVLKKTVDILISDSRFLTFLKICLNIGNALNVGGRRGNCYGFKITSLTSFATCKANDGNNYLMKYILEQIHDQNPSILGFLETLYENLQICKTFDLAGELFI
jgi:hypothetical protein